MISGLFCISNYLSTYVYSVKIYQDTACHVSPLLTISNFVELFGVLNSPLVLS